MEIIAITQEGDYIVRVSKAEWDGLQVGVKPGSTADERERKYYEWPNTEAGRFMATCKFQGKSAFARLYMDGKFDGSIDKLRSILSDINQVRQLRTLGEKNSQKFLQALLVYEAGQ